MPDSFDFFRLFIHPCVLVQWRPLFLGFLWTVGGCNLVICVFYHSGVSGVQRHGGLLSQHRLQVDLHPPVAVWTPEKELAAGLHQGAGHVDVVVGEVEDQLLQAEQCVGLGELLELGQLSDEAAHLELGLYVDLILLPDLPPEFLLEQSTKLDWDVSNARLKSGDQTTIK